MYCGNNYFLKQNLDLNKTSQYYYIDYQHIIKEQIDQLFNSLVRRLSTPQNNHEYNIEDEPRIFYGRTNRLQFKLCYDYCQTCKELGSSNDTQKCLYCLPNYQFDKYYDSSYIQNNCIPEGYYTVTQTNSLISNNPKESTYYIHSTNNQIISSEVNFEYNTSIPNLNETSKEVLYMEDVSYKYEEKNNSSNNIYDLIKNKLITDFSNIEDNYSKINTDNKYVFQITTVNNELESLLRNIRSNFSVIDLKECADILKKENGIASDADLILLKYENLEEKISNGNEKSIQYEVYAPNSKNKLDLSVCSKETINIYIPIELSEETKKLYEEFKTQGYNLFDKNDKFYNDICTPYKSENGTDVLLSDRFNDFFTPNQLNCQANCEYSDYLPDSQYLNCECNVVNEDKIETEEPEKITAESIAKSFYDILKYSNYKVLKCYKLVFRKVTFYINYGSILTIIYFTGYFIALIIFIYRKFFYLYTEIGKLFTKEKKESNKEKDIKKDNHIIYDQKRISIKMS